MNDLKSDNINSEIILEELQTWRHKCVNMVVKVNVC